MSGPLIAFVALIYVGVAVSYWREGNPGMCITFLGYAGANIGLIIAGQK